jgi:DNA/RNA-binding domain of Phe-tRNA-synthetase-like protein
MVTVVSGQPTILLSPAIRAIGPVQYHHRTLRGVHVGGRRTSLADECERLCRRWTGGPPLEDEPNVAAYHAFYRMAGLDPRRNRLPAVDLIARYLAKGTFPAVNNAVDGCNAACLQFLTAMAVFDLDKLRRQLIVRRAIAGEEFQQIGRDRPSRLPADRIVLADDTRVVSLFALKDSHFTKVDHTTENVLLAACQVPGIADATLEEALDYATRLICSAP